VIRDDSDPDDPAWTSTGGCALKQGDVNNADFNDELDSPLSWQSLDIRRGGKVPVAALNLGLTQAPECLASSDLLPGARLSLTDLSVGNHRFQCCIHPWMRAIIKVKPQD